MMGAWRPKTSTNKGIEERRVVDSQLRTIPGYLYPGGKALSTFPFLFFFSILFLCGSVIRAEPLHAPCTATRVRAPQPHFCGSKNTFLLCRQSWYGTIFQGHLCEFFPAWMLPLTAIKSVLLTPIAVPSSFPGNGYLAAIIQGH
jgi:hypothetical protein